MARARARPWLTDSQSIDPFFSWACFVFLCQSTPLHSRRQIRKLARKQFFARALAQKIFLVQHEAAKAEQQQQQQQQQQASRPSVASTAT
jgi:hypothetical protein